MFRHAAAVVVLLAVAGATTPASPVQLSYVYSDSMEPTIGTDDGFVLVPAGPVEKGDVVTFWSPERGEYVTHRVVGRTDGGYVTRGDNNDVSDQAAGYSPVTREEITGEVLTVGGDPLVVPGFGLLAATAADNRLLLLAVAGLLVVLSARGDGGGTVERDVLRSADLPEIAGEPVVFDPGDSVAWEVFVDGEATALDDVREADSVNDPDTPLRGALVLPLGDHGVLTVASTAVGAFEDPTRELAAILAASTEAALDRVERARDLTERDRQLREQEERLERLLRLNEVIRDVQVRLAEAADRRTVERHLCRRLAEIDRFAFAWIGSPEDDPDVRASAGHSAGYLDEVFAENGADPSRAAATDDLPDEPARRCAATGDPVVVPTIASDVQGNEWRGAALEAGFGSAASVPLGYDDRQFGVLTVYADVDGAFDDLARDALADLGRSAAHGVDAIEARQSLQADTAVELELSVSAPSHPLQRVARETGEQVTLMGSVPSTDDGLRLFVTVPDATPEAVRAAVDDDVDVVDVIDEDGDTRLELSTSGPNFVRWLVDRGAVPEEAVATPDGVRATVSVPGGVDVRSLVEAGASTFADAELLARQTVTLPVDGHAVRSLVDDRLTDRQQEVLRTAYHTGYFEWPRRRSGEDVAEELDIAQPTFHRHMRTCYRAIFGGLLEGRLD